MSFLEGYILLSVVKLPVDSGQDICRADRPAGVIIRRIRLNKQDIPTIIGDIELLDSKEYPWMVDHHAAPSELTSPINSSCGFIMT